MLCLGVIVGTEAYQHSCLLKALIVSAGVGLAAWGEIQANWFGVVLQLGSVLCDCTRCTIMQISMQANSQLKLSPIGTLYFVAPMAASVLFVPALLLELPVIRTLNSIPWAWLGGSCIATASLNIVVFTLVGKTSALTTSMVGPVKEAFCLFVGKEVYNTQITVQQWFGYSVALIGTTWYNYDKFLKQPGGQAPQFVARQPFLPSSPDKSEYATVASGAAHS